MMKNMTRMKWIVLIVALVFITSSNMCGIADAYAAISNQTLLKASRAPSKMACHSEAPQKDKSSQPCDQASCCHDLIANLVQVSPTIYTAGLDVYEFQELDFASAQHDVIVVRGRSSNSPPLINPQSLFLSKVFISSITSHAPPSITS